MMHVPDTNAVAANSCCSADMQHRVDDQQRIAPSEKIPSPATLLPPSQDESGFSKKCHGEARCETPPEPTPEQQYALTCLSEMLAVVGVDEELARGVDPVQQYSGKNRKVVTPPQPRSHYPTKVTPSGVSKQPKQDLGPIPSPPASKSNQRRTLFSLSKYQSPQSNYCNAERASSPSMSIVPTIDNARPSSRKLALRNLPHSSPDLLQSPQPAKSLLKKEKDTSADSSSPSSS